MKRRFAMVGLILAACGEKESAEPPATTGTDSDAPLVDTGPEDTGGGNAPDPAIPPTDVDAECWYWRVYDDASDGSTDGVGLVIVDPAQRSYGYATHIEEDYDVDGDVDEIADYSYDAAGNPLSWSYDYDGDGYFDTLYVATLDADFLYTRYTADDDGDGSLDRVYTYTNEGGLRIQSDLDEGDDGTVDMVFRYSYDAEGRRTGYIGDRGDDGVPDAIEVRTYPDPIGPDYTMTLDSEADGVVDDTYTYGFDAELRTIFYDHEDHVEDTRWVYAYTYDANSDVATLSSAYSEEGVEISLGLYTYTYLFAGRREQSVLVYESAPADYDGATWNYTWDCP